MFVLPFFQASNGQIWVISRIQVGAYRLPWPQLKVILTTAWVASGLMGTETGGGCVPQTSSDLQHLNQQLLEETRTLQLPQKESWLSSFSSLVRRPTKQRLIRLLPVRRNRHQHQPRPVLRRLVLHLVIQFRKMLPRRARTYITGIRGNTWGTNF